MRPYTHPVVAAVLTLVLSTSFGCASTRTVGEQIDDGAITSKINAKLTADPEVNPFNIDVDTLDGVVTLRGEVE
jgi:osmotically-inducible protein OsmY